MPTPQKISTLWVVVLFNMAFADILGFISPGFLAQATTGTIDGITITPGFLLLAAVLIEIAIAMIFLTSVLKPAVSRVANIGAALITALFIVGGGSTLPHYIFFASVELLALGSIAYLAWHWSPHA